MFFILGGSFFIHGIRFHPPYKKHVKKGEKKIYGVFINKNRSQHNVNEVNADAPRGGWASAC